MRLLAALVALISTLAAIGCGDSSDTDDLDASRYLNPKSQLVATIDLDYGGDQWKQIKRLYARAAGDDAARDLADTPLPATLDGALETVSRGFAGLSFDRDLRPLLDGKLLVGVHVTPARPPSATFERSGEPVEGQPRTEVDLVYRAPDGDAVGKLLDKLDEQGVERRPMRGVDDAELLSDEVAVVGGDTLVAAFSDGPDGPSGAALLRRRLRGKGPPKRSLPSMEGDALVRARATPGLLGLLLDRDALRRALRTRPGRALRSANLSVQLRDADARLDGTVDFAGLPEEELPLPGPEAIELPRDAGIGSGSADQSQTTVFIARLVRELYPQSRFIRRVRALERRERLRFEDAVLRQFSGPSQSILRPTAEGDTRFAARSSLRDPAAMRRLLPRIAPRLPGILEGLEGLGRVGLSGLLLVAPDAPLTPDAFNLLAAVEVRPLPKGDDSAPPDEDELLYEITGLEQERGVPGLDRVVYGVIGDEFVVASDRTLAREAAEMRTASAEPAGTRLRVNLPRLLRDAGEDDADVRLLQAIVAGAEVHASASKGDIVARGTVRWAP